MTDKEPESPNPAPIIGKPERGSSKMELYEYHKNNGSLAAFYDLYPESPRRHVEPERDRGGRER